jgi:hypothetical protein
MPSKVKRGSLKVTLELSRFDGIVHLDEIALPRIFG